ncbi:C-factor-like [Erpetoichthys calabaricus]|uniref:C-factor-like n=1 Tax=Erpetoichthys calabaricus TaxID=27687 RepID=A0A8C4RHB0_ERPCA|nr:C-factor-like [Erpetoichthys calabaricus]
MSGLHKCSSILVTGASRGIGLHLVETLMKSKPRPGKVIAAARDRSRAKELNRLAESHPDLYIVTLDVTNKDDIKAAFKEVESLVGDKGLNCLVNNAGIKLDSTLNEVTAEEMMKNFEVNTVSPLMVTKAFLPLLRKAAKQGTGMGIHRAAIVNVSSMLASIQLNWGEGTKEKWYPYHVSKTALNMVTRCLSSDLLGEGILCMSLCPGWVKTDMGGPQAQLTKEESIDNILKLISNLSEKDNGGFLNHTGETLPW